jgi:oligosaccharide amylase
MAVFQPNAVIGNSRSLVTLGGAGEIMSFFYPHIDFPQNIQEGMPAVYLGPLGGGTLSWTYEPVWRRQQLYVPRTNIVTTDLSHPTAGLDLQIIDFVLPRRDVLVRRFRLRNIGVEAREGALMQYLYLRLGETGRRNSARRLDDRQAIVQYWRHLCFAMGGDWPDATQIGKAHGSNSAKADMADGILSHQREELGDIDTAFAWHFTLDPGEELVRLFCISAAANESAAVHGLQHSLAQGYPALYEQTSSWWSTWLTTAVPVDLAPPITDTYYRSLLAIRLLYDERFGSILAAPEFDPEFERCGGYGFVWPRDAAEVVLALEAAGQGAMSEHFFEWARHTQRPEGYWEQRYWVSGELGPVWCSFLDSIQIDQTGSMVHALGQYAAHLSIYDRPSFYERYWPVVHSAATYLTAALGDDGLHTQAFDLWEKFRGSFTYSNAAIHAALTTGAEWARARGEEELAREWLARAARIKTVLMSQCWNGRYFARGFTEARELDWGLDSSMLGVFDPFSLLSLTVPAECLMVEQMVCTVRRRLRRRLPEGPAVIRHLDDDYIDGSAGGVNTLWLARVLLRLALHYIDRDVARAARYQRRAERYLRVVIARGTTTGLLPELIGTEREPRWAVPHGWAMAAFIQCALLLEQLRRR